MRIIFAYTDLHMSIIFRTFVLDLIHSVIFLRLCSSVQGCRLLFLVQIHLHMSNKSCIFVVAKIFRNDYFIKDRFVGIQAYLFMYLESGVCGTKSSDFGTIFAKNSSIFVENAFFLHFFAEKFCSIKKKSYLCTVKQKIAILTT